MHARPLELRPPASPLVRSPPITSRRVVCCVVAKAMFEVGVIIAVLITHVTAARRRTRRHTETVPAVLASLSSPRWLLVVFRAVQLIWRKHTFQGRWGEKVIIMRVCGAERPAETRRERRSDNRPSRSFPSVARRYARCSDAPCGDNGRRGEKGDEGVFGGPSDEVGGMVGDDVAPAKTAAGVLAANEDDARASNKDGATAAPAMAAPATAAPAKKGKATAAGARAGGSGNNTDGAPPGDKTTPPSVHSPPPAVMPWTKHIRHVLVRKVYEVGQLGPTIQTLTSAANSDMANETATERAETASYAMKRLSFSCLVSIRAARDVSFTRPSTHDCSPPGAGSKEVFRDDGGVGLPPRPGWGRLDCDHDFKDVMLKIRTCIVEIEEVAQVRPCTSARPLHGTPRPFLPGLLRRTVAAV